MKNRVLILSFLSLLWIGMAEASSVDEDGDNLRALLTKHPLTSSSSLSEQLALFKKVPESFKEEAKQLIPFKEAPIERPSLKATAECSPDEELEEDLSPRSPVVVDTETEIVFYGEDEMISCITNLCYPAAAALYEEGIRALFSSKKKPKHGAKELTIMLQCLGSKMLFAKALVEKTRLEEKIGENLQTAAINQVLNFHRPTLTEQSPTLVSSIPISIPGCSVCLGLPRTPK